MHYILRVLLHGFYVCHIRVADPSDTLIVARDKQVLDANAAALKRGVRVGMGLSEAKVLLRGGLVVAWKPADFVAAQEQWLDVAANYTSALEPDDQHSAYLDLSGHPDPLVIALRVIDAIEELGYRVEWCLAPTKWLAQIGAEMNAQEKPLQNTATFIWPLPINRLPISFEARERFHMLGYLTVGQLTELGIETLREQFGDEGLRIHQLVWGGGAERVHAKYPKDALAKQFYFEQPISDREVLNNALHSVADGLGCQLREKDLSGQEAQVAIDTEREVRSHRRRFSKQIVCEKTTYSAICLAMPNIEEPICGIRVRLPNLTKVERVQKSIDLTPNKRQLNPESAFTAVRHVFGDKAVQRAADMPTSRRERLLREWKNATGWR